MRDRAGAGRSSRFGAGLKAPPKDIPFHHPTESVRRDPLSPAMAGLSLSSESRATRSAEQGQMGRPGRVPEPAAMGVPQGRVEVGSVARPTALLNGPGDNPGVTSPLTETALFRARRGRLAPQVCRLSTTTVSFYETPQVIDMPALIRVGLGPALKPSPNRTHP